MAAAAEKLSCLLLEVRPVCVRRAVLEKRGLTRRQIEVLEWLARGKSNAQIAAILGRKPDTVAKHLQGVFDKLGVDNRSSAVAYAWEFRALRR